MTPEQYVQQKAAASGSSFYYAFLFLPKPRRAAITAFYAFCREVDDVVDDMVDTAGTLVKAAEVLKDRGAKKVIAYCTHPVLSGPAIERISQSTLDELVVVDTIPLSAAAKACGKICQLSCAELLAETFKRISTGDSVMSLFAD